MYQTCTEFGFYHTSDSANQPFGKLFPLKYVVSKTKPEAFITKLLLFFVIFF